MPNGQFAINSREVTKLANVGKALSILSENAAAHLNIPC